MLINGFHSDKASRMDAQLAKVCPANPHIETREIPAYRWPACRHHHRQYHRSVHIEHGCSMSVSVFKTLCRYISKNNNADFAMMLMPGSFYASSIVILSWITGSLSQPSVKRASAIALINAVCNTPNSMA
jgi:hypothetical protein